MTKLKIHLSQILPITNPEHYKLHLACTNGKDQPLDVFVRDKNEWDSWNAWRSGRDDFSRAFIFSLIDFYPQKDMWLFGGAYKVISRCNIVQSHSYVVEPLEEGANLIGRMKLVLKRPARGRAVYFEKYYNELEVFEILSSPYTGEVFCGYDQIDISFPMLEAIYKIQRSDWKSALENSKGVYLITDVSNGKKYVGSAYGVTGIWARWQCYIETGHGYNDELTRLIEANGKDYASKNFRFVLLEQRTMKTDDNVIIQRESYWKNVLLSRGEFGYNKN